MNCVKHNNNMNNNNSFTYQLECGRMYPILVDDHIEQFDEWKRTKQIRT